jgi:amino acid transporter
MSFALYVIGFLIVIGGVAWGLITAGVRPLYVMIACVILFGMGIVSAVTHTRSKDSPKGPSA